MKITELPSGMKSYPEGISFDIRKYTVGELKDLAEDTYTRREMYDFILAGVKPSMPMDLYDLSLYDANFFGIQRRVITLGQNSFRFVNYCQKCKKEVLDKVRTDQIEFYDMDAPELPVNVKLVDGTEISFGILTLKNFLDLVDRHEGRRDSIKWENLMACQCVSHSYEDALKILRENAGIEDLPVLEKVDLILYHGIMPITVHCEEATYKENPNAVVSLDEVNGMGFFELKNLADKLGVGYDETITNPQSLRNVIIMAVDIADVLPCGVVRDINLGTGEGMIVGESFREQRGDIDSAISFGKKSEHTTEREPETTA